MNLRVCSVSHIPAAIGWPDPNNKRGNYSPATISHSHVPLDLHIFHSA